MAFKRSRHSPKSRAAEFLQQPNGVVHARVQKVGPEHFGIVSVDCAKARSKWMLADFYGNILIPPTEVAHNRVELAAAVKQVRAAIAKHDLRDCLVAVERTGRYHHPVKNAFAKADFETRLVHPFTTKQFRQPADPDNKTDDTDLKAIHRAAVNGFALLEAAPQESWRQLQLFIRHRRDLVRKSSALACQIREHLDAALPGYAACFDKLWESEVAFRLVRQFGTAAALLEQGQTGLGEFLYQQKIRFQQRTLVTILTWAKNAAAPDVAAELHRQIALAYYDDHLRKSLEITTLEREIAHRLAQTPYILLLSCPGINVVSAADFAGEMGPIENYANSRSITGRAGLFPARHQSDRVDRAGHLARRSNRALRAAILGIADNLILCNAHFRNLANTWRLAGKDPRMTHVKVAARFCRIAFQIVAGRQVFRHPCLRERSLILDKLLAFHVEHETPMQETMRDLHHAITHIPKTEHAAEAKPLQERMQSMRERPKTGPQPIREAIAIVLARLGVGVINLNRQGKKTSRSRCRRAWPERLMTPSGKRSEKPGALCDHQRLIRQRGVFP
jgi:transposase